MKRPRLLVTGGSGYLGRWVAQLAAEFGDVAATYSTRPAQLDTVAWERLDVRDAISTERLVDEFEPQAIIHTAALNPGQGTDFEAVNVTGTANVARAAAKAGAKLIHISTDMVFDGQRGGYREDDALNPLNEYGRTKALAEEAVVDSGATAAIVRTSLIYGWRPTIARAAQWMIDALERGDTVRLWSDEMRNPIWVESLAAAVVELASVDFTGPLHIAGTEAVSRYEFGLALLRFHGVDTDPVLSVPSPVDQLRPLNCTLDSTLASQVLSTPLPGVSGVLARH